MLTSAQIETLKKIAESLLEQIKADTDSVVALLASHGANGQDHSDELAALCENVRVARSQHVAIWALANR